jgi:Ca2+-binding EF-hand superfamily protein
MLNFKEDLDLTKLFKRFDQHGRGVINRDDIRKGFEELGGPVGDYNFDLLVLKYAA